ncbi:hypothetical protein SLA2020_463060 [Shorea laevis]
MASTQSIFWVPTIKVGKDSINKKNKEISPNKIFILLINENKQSNEIDQHDEKNKAQNQRRDYRFLYLEFSAKTLNRIERKRNFPVYGTVDTGLVTCFIKALRLLWILLVHVRDRSLRFFDRSQCLFDRTTVGGKQTTTGG